MNTEIELWANTEAGSIAGVKQCIANGVDIHAKDVSTGQTALHKASVGGHVDIITLLLEQGCSVNEVDNEGFTALHLACGAADEVAAATVLLSQGHAFIDATDQQGMSPLMVATAAGYESVVNFLIAKKAYLHLKAQDGRTAVEMTPYGSRGRSIKEILQTAMTIREGVAFQSQGLHAEEAKEQWQTTFETQTAACYQELLAQRDAQRIAREEWERIEREKREALERARALAQAQAEEEAARLAQALALADAEEQARRDAKAAAAAALAAAALIQKPLPRGFTPTHLTDRLDFSRERNGYIPWGRQVILAIEHEDSHTLLTIFHEKKHLGADINTQADAQGYGGYHWSAWMHVCVGDTALHIAIKMNKLVAVHILLLLGADTHTLVNSQGHSASVLSESLLQRTTTSLLLETPRYLLPKLNIHDTPHTVRPVSTLVFAQIEEEKQRQNRGFPTKGRKQVFYDTLPAVTRAEEVNSLLHPLLNNNNNNNNNNDTTNNNDNNNNNNDGTIDNTIIKDGSNNDDSLTSAQAMAARALLLTPYDPPADPYLPPLATDPDASEDTRTAIAIANKDRSIIDQQRFKQKALARKTDTLLTTRSLLTGLQQQAFRLMEMGVHLYEHPPTPAAAVRQAKEEEKGIRARRLQSKASGNAPGQGLARSPSPTKKLKKKRGKAGGPGPGSGMKSSGSESESGGVQGSELAAGGKESEGEGTKARASPTTVVSFSPVPQDPPLEGKDGQVQTTDNKAQEKDKSVGTKAEKGTEKGTEKASKKGSKKSASKSGTGQESNSESENNSVASNRKKTDKKSDKKSEKKVEKKVEKKGDGGNPATTSADEKPKSKKNANKSEDEAGGESDVASVNSKASKGKVKGKSKGKTGDEDDGGESDVSSVNSKASKGKAKGKGKGKAGDKGQGGGGESGNKDAGKEAVVSALASSDEEGSIGSLGGGSLASLGEGVVGGGSPPPVRSKKTLSSKKTKASGSSRVGDGELAMYYPTEADLKVEKRVAARYEPLRRLCTLLTSQQQEFYNQQRTLYEQKMKEQWLRYRKPGIELGPGSASEPGLAPGSTPGPGLAPASGPELVASPSRPHSISMLSWDAWLFGKSQEKHRRDQDMVYQKQQRVVKEGALRAQGIIDRDGRERKWVSPEGQGLGLENVQGSGLGPGPGQGQGQEGVDINSITNTYAINDVNDVNDIDRLILPPLTPTSTSLHPYPHFIKEVSRYHNLKYAYVHDAMAMTYLAKAMFNHPLITHLVLPQCKLTDESVVVLSSCLSTLHALVYLDLSANCIGDEGALALALALQKGVEEKSVKVSKGKNDDDSINNNSNNNSNNSNNNNSDDNNTNNNNNEDDEVNNDNANVDNDDHEANHSSPSSPHRPSSPSSPLLQTSYGLGSAPGPGPGVSSVWSVVSMSSPQTAKEANERARLLGSREPNKSVTGGYVADATTMLAQGQGPGQDPAPGQGLESGQGQGIESMSERGSGNDRGGGSGRVAVGVGGKVVKCTLGVPLAHPRITTITRNNDHNSNDNNNNTTTTTTPSPAAPFLPPRLLQVVLANNAIGETGARALVEVALLPVTQGGFLVDDATLLAQGPGLTSASGPGLTSGVALISDPLGLPLIHNNLTLRLSLLNLRYNGISKRAQEKLHRYMGKISPYAMRKHKFGERSRSNSPQGQGLGQRLGDGPGQGQGQGEGLRQGDGLASATGPELGERQGSGSAPGLAAAIAPGPGLGRRGPPALGSLFKTSGNVSEASGGGGLNWGLGSTTSSTLYPSTVYDPLRSFEEKRFLNVCTIVL